MFDYVLNILRGKTVWRSSMNSLVRNITISGNTIDLGGKSSRATYFNHIRKTDNLKMTYTDLMPNPESDVVQLNVLERFPFGESTFDNVLAFNLLEHLPSLDNICSETYRILKKDGQLIIAVPYLFPYHPDPEDYCRYSDRYLISNLTSLGFRHQVTLFPKAGPCIVFADYLSIIAIPGFARWILRPFILGFALLADKMLLTIRPSFNGRSTQEAFAAGFVIVFIK